MLSQNDFSALTIDTTTMIAVVIVNLVAFLVWRHEMKKPERGGDFIFACRVLPAPIIIAAVCLGIYTAHVQKQDIRIGLETLERSHELPIDRIFEMSTSTSPVFRPVNAASAEAIAGPDGFDSHATPKHIVYLMKKRGVTGLELVRWTKPRSYFGLHMNPTLYLKATGTKEDLYYAVNARAYLMGIAKTAEETAETGTLRRTEEGFEKAMPVQ